jgi:hypothetical protein
MTDGTITIPNWDRFQHYKKKAPSWIKLYRDTLGDYQIMFGLTPDERWVLVGLWMLAAETGNAIPRDCGYLSTRLQAQVTDGVIEKLQGVGMIEVVEGSREGLDKVYSKSSLRREEKRREEKKNAHAREHVSDHFPEVPAEDLGPFKSEVSEPVPEELFSLMRSGETVYDVEKAWHLIVDAGIDSAAVVQARKDHCKERERTYWSGLAKWLKKTAAGGLPPESKKKTFNHRPDWVRALGKGGARTY